MANSILRKIDTTWLTQTNGIIQPDGFGIFLCTAGSCRLRFDDIAYTVGRDMLFIFKPFAPISTEYVSPDMQGVIMEIDVEKTMMILNDIPAEMRMEISRHPCVSMDHREAAMITKLLDIIQEKTDIIFSAETSGPMGFNQKMTDYLIRSVCYEVFRIYSAGSQADGLPAKRNNQIFSRFIGAVSRNCSRQRLVNYYAGQQHISTGHFASAIRAASGHGPTYWITLFTMTGIRRMLKDTDLSLKEIAEKMNFPDQSVFGRYFRQHEGISPIAYRSKIGT